MRYALLYYALLPILAFSTTVAVDDDMIPKTDNTIIWEASRYDYELEWYWWRSKTHNTCAVRELPKYSTWRVCNLETGECVECYQNDYWPKEYTNRIIDLSSHAFAEIGSLRAWVMQVSIEKIE